VETLLKALQQDLAATRLREHPTIPPSVEPAAAEHGELWPRAFCAFQGCMWEERIGTEAELEEHLREEHLAELEPICQHMLRKNAPDALRSVYNQAIAVKCRAQAPIAGPSLDRTALNSFADAMVKDKVEALICWCCGGIHPYVEEVTDSGPIQWYQPLEQSESTGEWLFLRQPVKVIEKLLGLQVYLSRYNLVPPKQVKLTDHETFEDWRLKLPELEDGNLLCCPEDLAMYTSQGCTYGQIRRNQT
jgi:hypothetical protein